LTVNYIHIAGPNTEFQQQVYSGHDEPGLSEPEPESDDEFKDLPATPTLVGMESYASIELGVANLEIMYQESLACIAMTSNGWRCPAVIHEEQLLKARDLLGSLVISGAETNMKSLVELVLCPGHALGDLPRIYSEKWGAFA